MLSSVDGNEYVKVLDFGLVKAVEQEEDEYLTSTGQVLGTPQYMPPEQAGGEAVDQRSDLFSLTGVFFFCLTGHSPYGANSVRKALTLSLQGNVPPVATYRQGAPVPDAIDKFIFKGLRPEKEDRFQTCEDFVQALQAALAGVPDSVLDAVPKFVANTDGGSSSAASRKSGAASRAKGVTAAARPLPKGSRAGTSRVEEPSRPSQGSAASASQAQGVPLGAVIGAMVVLVLVVGGAVVWKVTRPVAPPAPPEPAPVVAKVEPKPVAEVPVIVDLKVTLKTTPDAAEISEDGVAIGSTPHTLTWKPGATRTLTFKLAGHKDLTRTLRPEGDQTFEYTLEPLPKQAAPKKVTPKKSDDIGTFD
jgi:serine/threonine-protein kinase